MIILIQSAKLNGNDPHAYLKDVMTRRPTHKASRIGELLPHRWQSTGTGTKDMIASSGQ